MNKPENIRLSLDEIHEQSEKDLRLEKDQLVVESLKTPTLFSKYSKMLSVERLILKKLNIELETKEKETWEYYKGKAEPEIYKEKPFGHKVMKADMDRYIKIDPEIVKLKVKIALVEEKVDTIIRILKEVSNRQWIIRNANETNKFEAGL
jgi:hypothetical protein